MVLRVIKGAISVARKVNFISRLTFAIQIPTENKRASSQLLSLTSICNVCPQAEGLGGCLWAPQERARPDQQELPC